MVANRNKKVFEKLYVLFLIINIIPTYRHGIDLVYDYHYWHLTMHCTLLYCLLKQNSDTWWVLLALSSGMLIGHQWFIQHNFASMFVTSHNFQQYVIYKYPNIFIEPFVSYLIFFFSFMQLVLLIWILLKRTRVKYGIGVD
jgi:hypothetical protein